MSKNIKKRSNRESSDISSAKLMKGDDNISLNHYYFEPSFINEFRKGMFEKTDLTFVNGAQYFAQPFSCTVLPNFFSSVQYVEKLRHELNQIKLYDKNCDLFQFKQSDDLATSSLPAVKNLIDILYNKCRSWLKELTGFTLTDEVDMTCSRYDFTDVLLCHDDMLKGRRIAFIYYLVPDWEKEDGGTLDLFDTVDGNAGLIKHSIIPKFNSFVFFEVSPKSFHQVSEILKNKSRLSVNGWFHSNEYETKVITVSENKIFSVPQMLETDDITSWLNPIYLEPETILQIRNDFSETSEIELPNFLQEEKYKLVTSALKSETIKWDVVGPRNKRYFYKGINLPPIVEKCQRILHSEEMCLILSNLTGLQFHPLADVDSSSNSDESNSDDELNLKLKQKSDSKRESPQLANYISVVRRWSPGHYTLLHDNALHDSEELNAVLYFNCDEWNSEFGGFTSYVAKGETEELLRIEPSSNSLGLIYTDKETAGFVKYINNRVHAEQNSDTFYDILTTFYEQK